MYCYDAPQAFHPGRTTGALLMSMTLLLCGCGRVFAATPSLAGRGPHEIAVGPSRSGTAALSQYNAGPAGR